MPPNTKRPDNDGSVPLSGKLLVIDGFDPIKCQWKATAEAASAAAVKAAQKAFFSVERGIKSPMIKIA